MRNAGLDEAQAGLKIAGRNINNLRYADDTTLVAESKELKSLLMKAKEESEKVGLKLSIRVISLQLIKINEKKKPSALKKLRSWHPVRSLHSK